MDNQLKSHDLALVDFAKGELLLVDKPEGWTSFDVVNKIRGTIKRTYQLSKIKVGHAGTLDPIATGLLIICTGKSTTSLSTYQGLDKEYAGIMTLGATTASFDRETPVMNEKPYDHLNTAAIVDATQKFIGEIAQVPPMYSAIKVEGRPLYRSARKGQEVEIKPRNVTIHQFEITGVELPHVHFKVLCSKGTYIRSLAHDLGQVLGCGAYLSALRRTRIGEYRVEDAWEVAELISALEQVRIIPE